MAASVICHLGSKIVFLRTASVIFWKRIRTRAQIRVKRHLKICLIHRMLNVKTSIFYSKGMEFSNFRGAETLRYRETEIRYVIVMMTSSNRNISEISRVSVLYFTQSSYFGVPELLAIFPVLTCIRSPDWLDREIDIFLKSVVVVVVSYVKYPFSRVIFSEPLCPNLLWWITSVCHNF